MNISFKKNNWNINFTTKDTSKWEEFLVLAEKNTNLEIRNFLTKKFESSILNEKQLINFKIKDINLELMSETNNDVTKNILKSQKQLLEKDEKVQRLIQIGIDEGATLVAGGLGRPDGISEGYFVKPTVFADVTNDMTIAREEIFGPVLSILKYETEDEAIDIANDTDYGLAGYVQSGDEKHAKDVARKIRAGQISINRGNTGPAAPFGGFKTSGNGREHGLSGLNECLETKAILGS